MERKSLLIKILVPVLIVILIGGMWLIKNQRDRTDAPDNTLSQTEAKLPEGLEDANFDLRETEAIDFEKNASYGIPLIVDYGADTCIPCKEMAPVLEKANEEF